jgi:structure-specific endonuclease subunit SLX1
MDSSLRDGIHIKLDANAVDHYDKVAQSSKPTALTELEAQQKLLLNGVENLDFGYSSMKAHVEKSRTVLARADNTCAVCAKHTGNSENILLVCAHNHCEAVTHLHCLSKHFIQASSSGTEGPMLPIEGSCPSCKKQTQWQTLVKELTLRARGEKDLEKLFKKPRAKKNAKSTNGEPILDEFKTIEEIEEDESDDFRELEEFEASVIQEALEANIPEVAAKDPNTKKKATSRKTTTGSRRANPTMSPPGRRRGRPRKDSVSSVTGWSDAEVLD